MINQLLNNILAGIDIRQNLSSLRKEIKDPAKEIELSKLLVDCTSDIIQLLNSPDAKTRKNTALLMGDIPIPIFLPLLFEHYKTENQRFVRSAYLTALCSYDCITLIPELKEQLELLHNTPLTQENTKHIQEEIRVLSKLIIQEDGIQPHTFIGTPFPLDCIFTTNPLHKDILEADITERLSDSRENSDTRLMPFSAGVRIITDNLNALLPIRSYNELFFVIPGITTIEKNPVQAALSLANSNLLVLLKSMHQENTPFHFRLELKTKMVLSEKSKFAKRFASELERLTDRFLLNSTSNYEIEFRLIENKLGTFNILLKLFTIPDSRFDYRKESIAASIRPSNAAQLVALAKDYMIPDSRTLDPFCGVGTMLIERQKIVKGNTSYGIDFYEPAITKAKINTNEAGQIIHFINRNFFDFTHEYKFDEIFTNMPYETGHKTYDEIEILYRDFFPKAREVLTEEGTIIMYSHNPELVESLAPRYGYQIKEAYEFTRRKNTCLFILILR